MRTAILMGLASCTAGLSPTGGSPPVGADDGPGETGAEAPDTGTAPTNGSAAPLADAGPDFETLISQAVVLDGSGSTDPDGDPLLFAWEFTAIPVGSGTTLFDETTPNPQFFADRPGVYALRLTVDDGVWTASDAVEVTASAPNDDPIADAGADQAVDVGDNVQLNGSSSFDPNNDPLTYQWTLASAPAGSSATLIGAASALPEFVADLAGSYAIELEVSDGRATIGPDTVIIEARTAQSGGGGGCSCPPPQPVAQRLKLGDIGGLLPLPILIWVSRRRSVRERR